MYHRRPRLLTFTDFFSQSRSRTIQYRCRTALFLCLRDDDLTKTLNSIPTVTLERYSHFPRQKKRHRPLFAEKLGAA